MNNKEIDLTNKVVINVNEYIDNLNEINNLKNEVKEYKNKYENIINYLLSECEINKYVSGKKYLNYDSYNNHLADYLKKIEPELYEKELKREEIENKESDGNE
jgi:hypothetical protein